MRAVTQNRRMAASMGIRTGYVDAMTFGLGSGIAGIAGVALSQIDNVSPNLGQSYIIDSFMVVVFGGVGNLWGTLVSALTLGVTNKFLEPWAGAVLAKIVILVLLILFIQKRPRGLVRAQREGGGNMITRHLASLSDTGSRDLLRRSCWRRRTLCRDWQSCGCRKAILPCADPHRGADRKISVLRDPGSWRLISCGAIAAFFRLAMQRSSRLAATRWACT